MPATHRDLMQFSCTGKAYGDMTHYDKMHALSMFGKMPIQTLSGVPPIRFKGNGKPLISYNIVGNMVQETVPAKGWGLSQSTGFPYNRASSPTLKFWTFTKKICEVKAGDTIRIDVDFSSIDPPIGQNFLNWKFSVVKNGTKMQYVDGILNGYEREITSDGTLYLGVYASNSYEQYVDQYLNTIKMKINGNPVLAFPQECGDPTTNLCNVSNDNKLTYNSSYDNYVIDDDEQTVTTTGNCLVGFIVPVSASTAYTVYAKSTEYGMLRIREYSDYPSSWSGAEYIQQIINNETNYAYNFTTTANTKYVVVAFYFESSHTGAVISNIMLNIGSTPMDYVPYGYALDISCGGVTKTIYLREPLRKIGDYADTISSDGTVTRSIVKIELAKLKWRFSQTSTYALFIASAGSEFVERVGISNIFTFSATTSAAAQVDLSIRTYDSGGSQRLSIRYDALNGNTDSLYQALDGAYLWAVLDTATTETATVPTISTVKGENIFNVSTALKPSSVSITGNIKPV